ncbi:MAG: phosphopyruvate hydratase [Candidatus Woesearchaeota archaeon]|nr:phosphopyruvate hydratase [Candidatus Woesearchaeota archaeon]
MQNTVVKKILAREVLDSRGNPTIEVDVFTSAGYGREMVPSGASTGRHEAKELRDGGKRFCGKGVLKAISNINKIIAPKIKGMAVCDQEAIDAKLISLDGTSDKSNLGANAIMGVSLAVARAAAVAQKKHLHVWVKELANTTRCIIPAPFMNLINGGKHAGTNIDFQEFMIVPRAKTFSEALRIGSETYHELRKIILNKYGVAATNVGDEGGFTPHCHGVTCNIVEKLQEPLELLSEAAENAGHTKNVAFALDVAANELYDRKTGRYHVQGKEMSSETLSEIYAQLADRYPIVSLEDPFAEDDWQAFAELTYDLRRKTQIVGDDLLCTNPERIFRAIKQRACNCLLLKINQIGTITEALQAGRFAKRANWKVMVSHRSGETEDHFISDFAVGLGNQQIKAGAPCRGERTAKYNQLLRIEQELGKKACYSGTRCGI